MGYLRNFGVGRMGVFSRIYSCWQGKKDSNLRMLESKSSALTSLAIPLQVNLKKSNCKRDFYLAPEQFDLPILSEDFAKDFLVLRYLFQLLRL